MITVTECPICKNKNLQHHTRCKDFTVSHETFEVQKCHNCNFGITTPRPENEELGNYYQSEDYVSHSGKTSGGIGTIYKLARNFTLTWKKEIIQARKKTGSILDFGCGTGEFLNTMKSHGWKICGVEPTEIARQKAQKITGQTIHSTLNFDERFDVITAWHVIEHVPDIETTISKLTSLLKKDGILFIAVPNFDSPDSKRYNEYWAAYDVPRHLWHFSKQSMNNLFKNHGLKTLDIKPMKLDAYYVSLLSEKYKNQNKLSFISIIKSTIAGFVSNLKASTTKNHSSLIYIARANEN